MNTDRHGPGSAPTDYADSDRTAENAEDAEGLVGAWDLGLDWSLGLGHWDFVPRRASGLSIPLPARSLAPLLLPSIVLDFFDLFANILTFNVLCYRTLSRRI